MNRPSLALAFCLFASIANADDFYASPDGSSEGAGTLESPWDLNTALSGLEGGPGPGDTLNLAPGEYLGSVRVRTRGTEDQPLHIRGSRTGRTTLVSPPSAVSLVFDGDVAEPDADYVWVWDLEVTSEASDRFDEEPGAPYDVDIGGGMAASRAKGLHFINLVVHDTGQGFSLYNESHDAVIYGCVLYNNGFLSPVRGHGHGVYTHNSDVTKPKVIRHNIFLPQVGLLMQAYGTGSPILGVHLRENVFLDGSLILGGASRARVESIQLVDNFGYEARISLGYSGGFEENVDLEATGNYMAGHFQVSSSFQSLRIEDNVFAMMEAPVNMMVLNATGRGGSTDGWSIGRNTYYTADEQVWIQHGVGFYTLDAINTMFGHESGSSRISERPENRVIVQANEYDEDRAHLVVYNWTAQDEVEVDLASLGWVNGDRVRVRNARAIYDDVSDHTLEGGLGVVMTDRMRQPLPIGLDVPTGIRRTIPAPDGSERDPEGLGLSFFPEFGIFVLERIARAAPEMDAGMPDGGPGDAGAADGGLEDAGAPDAGASDAADVGALVDTGAELIPTDTGCGCRVSGGPRGMRGWWSAVALVAFVAARRRQR